MDERGIERAVLAGASMGAHTLLRFALEHPERAAALVVITPAYDPVDNDDPERLGALGRAGRRPARPAASRASSRPTAIPGVPEAWRETVITVLRQRLSAHEHPEAVADALHAVPRSRPFGTLHDLAAIEAPTVVVADRDEADPGHPLSVGEAYARVIPGARLVVEEPGRSPIAWQGSQLSKVIAEATGGAELELRPLGCRGRAIARHRCAGARARLLTELGAFLLDLLAVGADDVPLRAEGIDALALGGADLVLVALENRYSGCLL